MPSDSRVCRLHAPGDLRVETVAASAPGPGEVTVAIGAGGICGSDMHYYHDGGIGAIRVREPIILGHEAAGRVTALGDGVSGLSTGDLVAVNPSHPCNDCRFCAAGLQNQCPNMTFLGSAMYLPHAQGLFRDRVTVGAAQCHPLPGDVTMAEAACAEPLAVCLHALAMARSHMADLGGTRVLVTGAGPIGALCTAAASAGGASEIVVTDLQDFPLDIARRLGATATVNVADGPEGLSHWMEDRGRIDLVLECSAAAPAIAMAVDALRPRGLLIQVGSTGTATLPLGQIVAKEIALQGTFRFHEEFADAVRAIGTRAIDVRPAVTGAYPLAEAEAAFAAAADRSRAVKVQLTFADD